MARIASVTTKMTRTRPVLRRPGRFSWADVRQGLFFLDCRAARAAAGTVGAIGRGGRFRIWSETGEDLDTLVQDLDAAGWSAMADVLAGDPPSGPSRLMTFDNREAFAAYHRPLRAYRLGPFACISGWRSPRVAVCREEVDCFPSEVRDALALALGYTLAQARVRASSPKWVLHGLTFRVATRVAWATRAPGWQVRFLRAALFRGELATAVELFDQVDELFAEGSNADGRTDLGWLRFAAQSASLIDFLAETNRPKWDDFVARLSSTRDPLQLCEAVFRRFPDDLIVDWVDWFRQRDPGPHLEPPPTVRTEIDRLTGVIRDAAGPTSARMAAIRRLARGGHAWGCRAVIEVVDNDNVELSEAAVRALEDISGERQGDTASAWSRWLADLPVNAAGS